MRMTKDDGSFTPEIRIFLSQAYNLKAIADYDTSPDAEISAKRAEEATAKGKQFVSHIARLLSES